VLNEIIRSRPWFNTLIPIWPTVGCVAYVVVQLVTHDCIDAVFFANQCLRSCNNIVQWFLRAPAVPAGTAERVLAMGILSVCLSVTTRYRFKPGEIETPGLHRMIA